MLTREERAKAEELFGRNPDAMKEDIERALGRSADGMIDAIELGILQDRAKEEAKAAGAAASPKPAEDGPKARTEEAAKKPEGGAERFARVRITVDLTTRDDGVLAVRLQSAPAELSDRTDQSLRVRAAVLKLVARRAIDKIIDTMDRTWLDDAMLEAVLELEADLKAAKRKDD